ncbi:hypothetical protein BRDCF_p896 [Bacteroidales bacterium CF]|nr:hypothetical protein BRDCF_p896 [Bacteroidales bacterium CF]
MKLAKIATHPSDWLLEAQSVSDSIVSKKGLLRLYGFNCSFLFILECLCGTSFDNQLFL